MKFKNPEKKNWLVIIAVVFTGVLKFILADWLDLQVIYISAACLFWFIFIYIKFTKDPMILKQWGFQKYHFRESFLFLLPFGLIGITAIIIYGIICRITFLNWHIIPIFALYPLWGVIQQFIVAGLVAGNLKILANGKISDIKITLLISILFALIHYPSIALMIYAFVMEFIFLHAYFKYNNLWSIGLFHGWIASFFLYFVIGRDLWNELLRIFQ